MIEYAGKPFSEKESLEVLNSYARRWFTDTFKEPTPPQRYTFRLISERRNMLVAAPTGSGKTMSGFLSIISALFDKSLRGELEEKIYCIYVSPLRALNNDIYRNLSRPLEEIYELIRKEKGVDMIKENIRKVTIGVRTGDTTQTERRKMLEKPPNILVTTPESLAILINSERFMEKMMLLEYMIVDEIHELANNKRGVHLSLSVERLEEMVDHPFTRIGLGATLYPMEEAAKFLVGFRDGRPRDCVIVDAAWSKRFEAIAISPVKDLIYTEESVIEDLTYKEIEKIIKTSRTTLIFTNTRSGTERVVFNLKRRLGYTEEDVAAHHGSLSRGMRFEVEELLKKGALRCVVSSTSLELGIDIGTIDNVVQLGSPKSVTRAVQRIGRAGHTYKAIAKGEMIVLNRDDLVECAVMLYAAKKRLLDSFTVPKNALDVLAQHIMGMSITRKWDVDEAYSLIRGTYAYSELDRGDYLGLLEYLAGNYVGLESRRVYGKIWYDKETNMFGRRGKMARVIYMTNLGTIPDTVAVEVYEGKKKIGSVEEEFLEKLKPGDIFSLGGRLYSFESAKGMRCQVTAAKSSSPTIPPWFSEQLPLSFELAEAIGRFRKKLAEAIQEHHRKNRIAKVGIDIRIPDEARAILDELPADENAKLAMYRYFEEQLLFAGEVPNDKLLLIEETVNRQSGDNYLIFHALYGRRVNDALSRIAALALSDMMMMDVGILVSDNGFVLTVAKSADLNRSTLGKLMRKMTDPGMISMLKANIRRTEMMKRRFRQVAARSFMILRNYKGWKATVRNQQINALLLLKASEEIDPNFPVIAETYREIFNDVMDLPRANQVISGLSTGEIEYKFIRTPSPSPFSHLMVTLGHADVVAMRERQMHLQYLHRQVMSRIKEL